MTQQQERYQINPAIPTGEAYNLYTSFLERLDECRRGPGMQRRVAEELRDADALDALPAADKLTMRSFFDLMVDLSRVGWGLERAAPDEDALTATAPDATRPETGARAEAKRNLRQMLLYARDEQLRTPEVRAFVRDMERPRWFRGEQVSVLDLLAVGVDLARDIEKRMERPEEIRDDLLFDSVRPYIQLVDDSSDRHTGLRLRDIWRYCRYSWSLPQQGQPGRRMQYLIRDGARRKHPIMGIGALGNSVVQITCRDEEVGWLLSSLDPDEDKFESRLQALRRALWSSIDDIYTEDFVEDETLSEDDLADPNQEVLARLDAIVSQEPARKREESEEDDLEDIARSPLYRHKRAKTLSRLLRAKRQWLSAASGREGDAEVGKALLENEEGQRALKTALRCVKKHHIGASIMNITTCGAIPPYNDLLVGKLASILLASPKVIKDYQEKYGGSASHIASRMSGEEVVKKNNLVLLETTSLYHVGSSQYNRLKVETEQGEVRFTKLGKTNGFGSVHISKSTYDQLQELLDGHPELSRQKNSFGHGVNYKLRSISSALTHLNLSKLQKHESPRLVYIVPLANNWREYLTGVDDGPDYIYSDIDDPDAETESLILHWKRRWFVKRAQRRDVLSRLKKLEEPLKVSTLGGSDEEEEDQDPSAPEVNPRSSMPSTPTIPWRTFATLVDSRASFAELLTPEEMAALHVKMKLDDGLREVILKDNKRLYLTGNPGDGKTHLLKKYERELREAGAFVNLDASATDEASLIEGIEGAIAEGRPIAIAINEGPLRSIVRKLPGEERAALERQLRNPLSYKPGDEPQSDAVLVHLGIRQVLERREDALNVALNHVDYEDAPAAVLRNFERLKDPRVRERLMALLKRVAQRGVHVTMHQLFGFFAFIITGGKSDPKQAEQIGPYSDLVFDSKNPIYHLTKSLDPGQLAHPIWDMVLWEDDPRGKIEWSTQRPDPIDMNGVMFRQAKRAFYFEARQGDSLFEMLPQAEVEFHKLLNEFDSARETAKVRLMEALAQFFGEREQSDDEVSLPLWKGLRFDARTPPTALISSQSLTASKVELLLPELPASSAPFISYQPDHVRLQLKDISDTAAVRKPAGLVVDMELWLELDKIRKGMPARYRDEAIARRLGRFLSSVSAQLEAPPSGYVRLNVRDVESGQTYKVQVSLEKREYNI